jgi:tRNA (mo5U34)-methyltransferase
MSRCRPDAADNIEVRAEIERLGPWFHNLELGGERTAPDHFLGDYPRFKFERFSHVLPDDLSGKTVLDIGCNAGFYAIEMKRRRAERVVAIDSDDHYLAQARFASSQLGFSDIEFHRLDVYDVAKLGERFDLVLFMGVLYHLRHPLLALDLIREHVARDLMLFQSMQRGAATISDVPDDHPFHVPSTFDEPAYFEDAGYPKLHFVERLYAGDWTNWWIPNRACSKAMLRAAGFTIIANPEAEVMLCRVASIPFGDHQEGPMAAYPARGEKA